MRPRPKSPPNCGTLRPIGEVAAEVVADLNFRRKAQQLYRLGDRVLGEFLAELGAERGIATVINQKLERYTEIEPEVLEAAGGGSFWPSPLHEIQPNTEPPGLQPHVRGEDRRYGDLLGR